MSAPLIYLSILPIYLSVLLIHILIFYLYIFIFIHKHLYIFIRTKSTIYIYIHVRHLAHCVVGGSTRVGLIGNFDHSMERNGACRIRLLRGI